MIEKKETLTSSTDRKQRLSTNVFSSVAVNTSKVFLQLFVTPLIIFHLGSEQYGLVAFSFTVQSFFFLLDHAVSPVVIREFGLLSGSKDTAEDHWKLFLTFEKLSVATGIVCGTSIIISAPWIAEAWLKSDKLSVDFLTNAVRLIGLLMIFQWPSLFYGSCFIGMQKQFSLATLSVTLSYTQAVFVLLYLGFFGSNVLFILGLQCFFSFLLLFFIRKRILKCLPPVSKRPTYDFSYFLKVRNFAQGTFLIGITIAILTQIDKIFISKFAKLDEFSAYSVSFAFISQISMIIAGPLMATLQPFFAGLIKKDDALMLANEYHKLSQVNAIVIFTFIGPLIFFSDIILTLWLGMSSPVLPLALQLVPWIAVGSTINAINSMPYTLQIAAGWTNLKLRMNIIQVFLFVALFFLFYPVYGLMIGPCLWIGLNSLNTFIEAPIVHRYYLKGEYSAWLFKDVLYPALISAVIFSAGRYFLIFKQNLWADLASACFISLSVFLSLTLALPQGKILILRGIERLYRRLLSKNF